VSTSYGVVLLQSVQATMRAEKLLRKAGRQVKLMPVPRQISSDCGVCLRFLWEEREAVEEALRGAGLTIEGIHPID